MLRRLVMCALALAALAMLEGCGVNRLAGPQVDNLRSMPGALGDHPRTDDGGGGGTGFSPPTEAPASASDTLRTGDGDGGRPRTD